MRIWVDDVRPAPKGYIWCKSVNEAKVAIEIIEVMELESAYLLDKKVKTIDDKYQKLISNITMNNYYYAYKMITLIDINHDAGDYVFDGGDYIKLLDWLEETGRNYPIRIHSMNPVRRENMRRIIRKNRWHEIK